MPEEKKEKKEQGVRAKSDIYQGGVTITYERGKVYDKKNIKNFASLAHLFEKVGEVAIVSGDDSVKLQALNTKNSELETSNKDLTKKVEELEKDKKVSLNEIKALVKQVQKLSPTFFDTAGSFLKGIFSKTESSNS